MRRAEGPSGRDEGGGPGRLRALLALSYSPGRSARAPIGPHLARFLVALEGQTKGPRSLTRVGKRAVVAPTGVDPVTFRFSVERDESVLA